MGKFFNDKDELRWKWVVSLMGILVIVTFTYFQPLASKPTQTKNITKGEPTPTPATPKRYEPVFYTDAEGFECADIVGALGSFIPPCPFSTKEIYTDINGSLESRHCCRVKWNKSFENTCRLTSCEVSTRHASDLCSTFIPRFIDDGSTQLEYEEIETLPCSSHQGDEGRQALCCVAGSTQSNIASTFGFGAEHEEFPVMVKVRNDGRDCAGTVYNRKFVIVASHCVSYPTADRSMNHTERMQVILASNFAEANIYNVSKVISHPKTSFIIGKHFGHFLLYDIALVELTTELPGNVKALEIPSKDFHPSTYANDAVLVGWGPSIQTEDSSESYAFLHKTHFPIESDHACFENQNIRDFKGLKDQFLCLRGTSDETSGLRNPIVSNQSKVESAAAICRGPNGTAIFCGVASVSGQVHNCQDDCLPTMYVSISFYSDWIKETAGVQDPETLYKPYLFGKVVPKGEFPHQVHITTATGKTCGGTLIAADMVLTIAQCVGDVGGISYTDLKVTAWINDSSESGKSYGVAGLATYPGFERIGHPLDIHNQGNRVMFTDNLYVNDIALLRLNQKTDISPSQLPAISMELNPLYATEYAFTRGTNGSHLQEMRTRDFRILAHSQCQSRIDRLPMALEDMVYFDEKLLCGVEVFSGGSICDRELGGGVICKGANGRNNLCGLQVFRLCEYSAPSIFIDIGMYAKWIKDTMAKLQKMM